MKNELKCCPFCGGKVNLKRAPMFGTCAFICENTDCGADVMFYGAEAEVKKAKERWNRREQNDEIDRR